MGNQLRQYDSKAVALTMAAIPLVGFARGEFCRIEPEGEDWGFEEGADGESVRWRINLNSGIATVILQGSSPSNDLLSELRNRDLRSPSGAGVGPFEARDTNGTSVFKSPQSFILGLPSKSFGIETGTIEWRIRLANMSAFIGSNRQVISLANG